MRLLGSRDPRVCAGGAGAGINVCVSVCLREKCEIQTYICTCTTEHNIRMARESFACEGSRQADQSRVRAFAVCVAVTAHRATKQFGDDVVVVCEMCRGRVGIPCIRRRDGGQRAYITGGLRMRTTKRRSEGNAVIVKTVFVYYVAVAVSNHVIPSSYFCGALALGRRVDKCAHRLQHETPNSTSSQPAAEEVVVCAGCDDVRVHAAAVAAARDFAKMRERVFACTRPLLLTLASSYDGYVHICSSQFIGR